MSDPLDFASGSPDLEPNGPRDVFGGSPRSVERMDRVLSLIRQEWLTHQDERFWQLLSNLAARMGIASYASILEDEQFIEMLEQHLKATTESSESRAD